MPILSVPLGIPRTKKDNKKDTKKDNKKDNKKDTKKHRRRKKSNSQIPPSPKYIEPSPPPIITDYIRNFFVIIIQSSIRTYLQKQKYKKLLDEYISFPLKKKNKKKQLKQNQGNVAKI